MSSLPEIFNADFTAALSFAMFYSALLGAGIYLILKSVFITIRSNNSQLKYLIAFSSMIVLLTLSLKMFFDVYFANHSSLNNFIMIKAGTNQVVYKNTGSNNLGLFAAIFTKIASRILDYRDYFAALWLTGSLFVWSKFILSTVFSVKISTGIGKFTDIKLEKILVEIKKSLSGIKSLQIYASDKTGTPMVIGLFKPLILFPVSAISHLTVEQVNSIIIHEIAHIKRFDPLMKTIQSLIEVVLFFNPFVWLISKITDEQREKSCDDFVLRYMDNRMEYIKALTILAELKIFAFAPGIAAVSRTSQLMRRIKRIAGIDEVNKNNPLFPVGLLLTVISGFFLLNILTADYNHNNSNQIPYSLSNKIDLNHLHELFENKYSYKTGTSNTGSGKSNPEYLTTGDLDPSNFHRQTANKFSDTLTVILKDFNFGLNKSAELESFSNKELEKHGELQEFPDDIKNLSVKFSENGFRINLPEINKREIANLKEQIMKLKSIFGSLNTELIYNGPAPEK